MDYLFIRESFTAESIAKSILSIQVSLDGFSFIVSPLNISQGPDYIFIKNISPELRELLTAIKDHTDFDLKEFYSIRIIIHNSVFALVPDVLFDLKDMKAYLSLQHSPLPNRKVMSNRIAPGAAISVFSVENELYRILKNKFPGADFCHSSLPFCSMAINHGESGCYAQIYRNSMEVATITDKKLALYNVYEIQNDNDILFFILSNYKSAGLDPMNYPLLLAGNLSDDSDIFIQGKKYINDIRFYSPGYPLPKDNQQAEYPPQYFLNHREILSCEL